MKKLAIITSHPIQYNAPLFRLLAGKSGIDVKVFYTLGQDASQFIDKGFGKKISWDVPLLEGYEFEFVRNASSEPGTSHFNGIINPDLVDRVLSFGATDILVYGWSFRSHLKVMRYFKGKCRVFFRGDSTLLDEGAGIKSILRRFALKWIYKHIDKALYVGTNNRAYFLKHGVSEKNLIFAPHAIDNDRFGNDLIYKDAVKELRVKLRIEEEDRVILFVGKFEKKKNPLLLVRAFNAISKPNLKLLLVGDGALEEHLKEESKENPGIIFLPFQNQMQMPVIYRAADVLVLPSSGPGETWGLCMNEAMASGLPIIASSKVGGAIDLVRENINGNIFEADNAESLQKVLERYASLSSSELKRQSNASKEIIASWSYEHIVSSIRHSLYAED